MDGRQRRWVQRVRSRSSCNIKVVGITSKLRKGILHKLKTNEMMTWRTLGDDMPDMVNNGVGHGSHVAMAR